MTRLSVNINKIATLRNARGGTIPDVVKAAVNCQKFGAQGITIHPRPDERHIRRQDVFDIKPVIVTEYNIEGYPAEDFLKLVTEVKADQVTLVPDRHGQLTSDHGWNIRRHLAFLRETVARLHESGIRTSLFVDPDVKQIESAGITGTDRIELYTEPYAAGFPADPDKVIYPYIRAAEAANAVGLGINAGHDLNLQNLRFFISHIPSVLEVSIGHALISDALYFGLEDTIRRYLESLRF